MREDRIRVAKYTVHMTQMVSVTLTVDGEDVEDAIERAYDERPGGICAQCSGRGQGWARDDGGDLMIESVEDETGTEVYVEPEQWRRVQCEPGA